MTAEIELTTILRDIAARRRNSVGDFWSLDYCDEAADVIAAKDVEIARLNEVAAELARTMVIAEARAERLAEALLRYGRHEHHCDTRHDSAYKPRPSCTCGLAALLRDQEEGK